MRFWVQNSEFCRFVDAKPLAGVRFVSKLGAKVE